MKPKSNHPSSGNDFLLYQTEDGRTRIQCRFADKPYAPRLAVGDRLAFRLRANPTIARKEEGKKNSPRHDVVMDAQYQLLREAR